MREKGFFAPLVVKEPKERSEIKRLVRKKKNQENEKGTSRVYEFT
jgi:hypothetical protein